MGDEKALLAFWVSHCLKQVNPGSEPFNHRVIQLSTPLQLLLIQEAPCVHRQ